MSDQPKKKTYREILQRISELRKRKLELVTSLRKKVDARKIELLLHSVKGPRNNA